MVSTLPHFDLLGWVWQWWRGFFFISGLTSRIRSVFSSVFCNCFYYHLLLIRCSVSTASVSNFLITKFSYFLYYGFPEDTANAESDKSSCISSYTLMGNRVWLNRRVSSCSEAVVEAITLHFRNELIPDKVCVWHLDDTWFQLFI